MEIYCTVIYQKFPLFHDIIVYGNIFYPYVSYSGFFPLFLSVTFYYFWIVGNSQIHSFIYLSNGLSCALSLPRKRQYYVTFYEYRCIIHRVVSLLRETPNYLFHARTSKLSVHPTINTRFLLRQNQYRDYRMDSLLKNVWKT